MASLLPVGVYGLEVPAGDVMVSAQINFPGTFRLTMAAIDPSAAPKHTGTANGDAPARATLKIIYEPIDPTEDSDDDSAEEGYLQQLIQASQEESEDEESSSDEEEKNGGPSDPSKSKKARKQAAVEQMMKALAEEKSEDEMDVDSATKTNGALSKAKKGKGKATEEDEESSEGEDEEGGNDLEELVLCTLDPTKNYQQPLDLTIGEDQRAFFKVSGTHTIYLTGNYVIPVGGDHDHQHGKEDDEDYDLSPDEEDLYDEDESDELDDIKDPRITEVDSEEDAPPKLATKEEPAKKGKNKRVAEDSVDEPASLDDIMAKSLKAEEPAANDEVKLSKKQRKKLKNNAGKGVETKTESTDSKKDEQKVKGTPEQKGDKKVQFAKNLEQGPSTAKKDAKTESKTGSKADTKAEGKSDSQKEGEKQKAGLGLKVVQGVSVDDKKLGKGPAAKKGDKVGMRYIGKLQDGKVFDANKKGTPFTFKLGASEVIKGWDIGVIGMSVGGERRLTVPAHLAYGSKAIPGIPANSQLIFDVKLLEIK